MSFIISVAMSIHLPWVDRAMFINNLMNYFGLELIMITCIVTSIIIVSLPFWIVSIIVPILVGRLHFKRSILNIVAFSMAMKFCSFCHLKWSIDVIYILSLVVYSAVSIYKLEWCISISFIVILVFSRLIVVFLILVVSGPLPFPWRLPVIEVPVCPPTSTILMSILHIL